MIRLAVILFGIFLATGLSTQSSAQTTVLIHNSEFQKDAVTAIDSLYNRNTDASREVMSSWKQSHPDHPIWTMWDAMEVWWEVLEDLYDHSLDDKLMEMMQRSEYQAGRILSRESGHPDALIIRALANGYIARHYANRGHWVTSVRTARRAYVTYQELMDVEPDFIDNEFVRGMISYYADYIPDEYPAVRVVSWFLPDGDRVEGLKKINRAAEEGIFSRPEATYFMGNILLNYERDYSAAHGHFQRLIDQYPDNSYYRRLMVRTLSNQGRNQEVLTQVNNAIEHWEMQGRYNDRVMLEELRFWEGRAYYRMNKFEDAMKAFKLAIDHGKSLPNRPDRLYYSVANYYAGLTSEALQETAKAKEYYTETVKQDVEGSFKSRARQRLREL